MPLPETYGKTAANIFKLAIQNGKMDYGTFRGYSANATPIELFLDGKTPDRFVVPNGVVVGVRSIGVYNLNGTQVAIVGTHQFIGTGAGVTVTGSFNNLVGGTANTTLVFAASGTENVTLTFTGAAGANRVRLRCEVTSLYNLDDFAD